MGELWEERLGDNDRAVEAFKEVLTVDPQNLEALKALERLYEKTGKMEAYLDVLEHELEVTGVGRGAGRAVHPHGGGLGADSSTSPTGPSTPCRRSC